MVPKIAKSKFKVTLNSLFRSNARTLTTEPTTREKKEKKIMKLEPGFPVIREAVTAIYRAAFGRLKRNFAFFSAV